MSTEEFAKCGRCGKALPCFSSEWSKLPDSKKCRCVHPINPPSPILRLLKWLVAALEADCHCAGSCPCHTGVQITGVPCPPDCPNYGKRFDGCHRCDCKPQSANAKSRKRRKTAKKSANV